MNLQKIKSLGFSCALALAATSVNADAPGSYKAGIWVDPDGCQHWVMDLGVEGMMSPVLTPDGRPVCGGQPTCADLSGDALFAIDSAVVRANAKSAIVSLASSIKAAGTGSVSVVGHTDSTASNAYNQGLSERRAQAVASILSANGLPVNSVSGKGEDEPRATNATKAGRQSNRRVEIYCR